jgi:HEAT repeat protein
MTNKSAFIQCVAINNLSLLGTNASPSIPALIQCLDVMGDSADLFALRRLALVELGQIGKRPDIVVTALIRSFKKENSFILRVAAINSLGCYAKENPSAYAELVAASTEDNELHVKAAAKAALKQIQNP